MDRLKTFLSFEGRASRLTYWRMQVAIAIAACAVIALTVLATHAGPVFGAVAFAPIVLVLLASIGIVVRRLHDRGKSGFWALLFVVLPFLLTGAGGSGSYDVPALFGLIGVGLSLWGLVEIGFLRGTVGENAYGVPSAR